MLKQSHVCSQVLESRSVDEQTDLAQRGIDVAVTDTARAALVEFCSHSHWHWDSRQARLIVMLCCVCVPFEIRCLTNLQIEMQVLKMK